MTLNDIHKGQCSMGDGKKKKPNTPELSSWRTLIYSEIVGYFRSSKILAEA